MKKLCQYIVYTVKVPHSCLTVCNPGLYSRWYSPGQNTGVCSLSLLQGIFPTQESNPGLPYCRRILYQLSHKGSPRILEWVAYPFSSGSSWPRNRTGVSCIAGRFFTNWAIREALTLPTKVHIFKAMVFPVVWIWKLDHNEGWVPKNWRFELWCWRRLLRVPWIARRSNQSILKDINPEYSLEGLTLKLQYFGHLMWRTDSLEKTLMLGKAEGRRRREWQRMRWLVGIWAVSSFWLLWAMLLCLCRHMFAFLLGRYLGVEQLGGMVTLWLSFWGTARLFSKATAQIFHSHWKYASPIVSPTLPALVIIYLLYYSHPSRYELASDCGFDLHFSHG